MPITAEPRTAPIKAISEEQPAASIHSLAVHSEGLWGIAGLDVFVANFQ